MRTGHSLTICLSLLPRGGSPKKSKKKSKKKIKKIKKKILKKQEKIKKKIKKNLGPLGHTPQTTPPGPDTPRD